MSFYRYRCEQCRTTSPPTPTRAAAEAEQDRHRRRAHGGHIPDGDRIDPDTEDSTSRARAWFATLAVLAVAGWISRRF
jgi:hypothetical protein